jgi:hypothetical protein
MTADSSGLGRNASFPNSVAWVSKNTTAVQGNFAVQLSAAQHQCITMPFYNFTMTETRTLWVKTTSTQTSGLFSSWLSGAAPVSIELRMVQGRPQAFVFTGTAGYRYGASSSSAVINDNQWHHVGMVRSSGFFALYVDGVAVGSATSVLTASQLSSLSARINSVAIGCCAYASAALSPLYYDGMLDDVRQYQAALSSADIAGLCKCFLAANTYIFIFIFSKIVFFLRKACAWGN